MKRPLIIPAILTMLSVLAVAAYLILPGMWQWGHAEALIEAKKPHPILTPEQPVDPIQVARLASASSAVQGGPIVITYHDVGYNPSKYTVTPEAFADQMRMLHDGGWITLTAQQISNWLDGALLPPHSVWITFDDGCKGVWQYADPVLNRYGMRATAYIITGFVGTNQPYYMTWDEITDLHRTGRWDLEAHTHLGHVQVASDDHGGKAPYLTTAEWIPDQRRMETPAEYRNRVTNDLAECKRQLVAHGFPVPIFFAYPFSAHEDDPNSTDNWLQQTVLSMYRAAMLDDSTDITTTSSNDVLRGEIQRMDITADLTPERFVTKMISTAPMDPIAAQPLTDPGGWIDETGLLVTLDTDGSTGTLVPEPGREMVRSYAPMRSSMWDHYTLTVDVGGFAIPNTEENSAQAGISVLKPPNADGQVPARVDVTVYSNSYSVNARGLMEVPPQPLVEGPTHHVVIDVTESRVSVMVDNEPATVIDVPQHAVRTMSGGMALYAYRQTDAAPPVTFSNLILTQP